MQSAVLAQSRRSGSKVPRRAEEGTSGSRGASQATAKGRKAPPRKEWRSKQTKADEKPSADVNMVFVLPSEFRAPQPEELAIEQLDLGPQPIIFEKPMD